MVQIIACRLVGAKTLSEPKLDNCLFEPEQISVNSLAKLIHFHSSKSISKCRLRNGSNFVTASMCFNHLHKACLCIQQHWFIWWLIWALWWNKESADVHDIQQAVKYSIIPFELSASVYEHNNLTQYSRNCNVPLHWHWHLARCWFWYSYIIRSCGYMVI